MNLKKSLLTIILILMMFIGVNSVFAETLWVGEQSLYSDENDQAYDDDEIKPITVRNKTLNGVTAYCISGINKTASAGNCTVNNNLFSATDTQANDTYRSVIAQIINIGCPNGCTQFGTEYVITEVAVFEYLMDVGVLSTGAGVHDTDHKILQDAADELIVKAKAASTYSIYNSKFNVEFNTDELKFTRVGDVYKSQDIKLNEIPNVDTSTVEIDDISVSGVSGISKVGDYNSFYITVPVANVTKTSTITVSISNVKQKSYSIVDTYSCEGDQDVAILSTKQRTGSDSISGTIKPLGKLTINKVDTNNNPVKDAKIKITGPNNYSVEYVTDGTSKVLENLTYGTYKIVEISAPEGYIIAGQKEVTLSDDNLSQIVSMVDNKTKVVISKIDVTTGKELPGATLQVLDSTGKELYKWVSTNKPYEIEGLPAGKYTLKETIAPEGYALNETEVEFEVKADGTTTQVEMKNELTKVVISKINAANGKELPGATLQVLDAEGNPILDNEGNELYKWVSTEEPYVIEGLLAGNYKLKELIAPEGYVLNDSIIDFEIKGDGSVTSVEMKNELEVKVPNTLSSRSSLLIAISMFDIALGIGILTYVKKNKTEE